METKKTVESGGVKNKYAQKKTERKKNKKPTLLDSAMKGANMPPFGI